MTDDEPLGPPPIEPMSDAAWSRVERGLWSRLDAPGVTARSAAKPRRWWIVAGPLVAAAAIVAIVIATTAPTAEIADEPSRAVSGPAPSSVSFGDAHIELAADTALVMSHENGHPVVMLEHGAAWFTVAARLERPAFVVRAGDAAVRVVGTRFRVARSDERVVVDVARGVVDVRFRGDAVLVSANQRWSSESPGHSAVIATTVPRTAPAVEPAGGDDVAEPPRSAGAPSVPGPAVTPPSSPPRAPSGPRLGAKPSSTPAASRRPVPPDNIDTTVEPTRGPADATTTDRDRVEYDRLSTLEPTSPDAALAGYLVLARGVGRWSDPALFAAARLAADLRDRRAEALLEIYVRRFPRGANAVDARQLLARLRGALP